MRKIIIGKFTILLNNMCTYFCHRLSKIGQCYFSSNRRQTEMYLERQASDQYSRRAKEHSYRARSAFKLLQINDKMQFIKPGLVAIDAGAAPGSWCQVLSELIFPEKFTPKGHAETEKRANDCSFAKHPEGFILGVDLLTISPIANVDLLCKADFTRKATQAEIRRRLNGRRAQLLLSDMAPNPTGESYMDHLRIIKLCRDFFRFGTASEPEPILAPDGILLCKIFDGIHKNDFMMELKTKFKSVQIVKPDASRDASSETYLFASRFIERRKEK